MKHNTLGAAALASAYALILNSTSAAVVTFETVTLPPAGYWNGSDLSGTPSTGPLGDTAYSQSKNIEGSGFRNTYNSTYGSWSGFAVSNHTNTISSALSNQYSSYAGGGAGSANYAVGYYATYEVTTNVTLGALTNLAGKGGAFTNTTYTALDMINGVTYGKKFGGVTGNDSDWLKLTISGFAGGLATGNIDFYLADYRFSDNLQDYILDEWTFVDFTSLGSVDELRFTMSSSDNDAFGMKTPSYFAMDNFLAVPEPSSLLISIASLGLFLRRKR